MADDYNPFSSLGVLLGIGTQARHDQKALEIERMQQAGADRRAGIAAGTAARALSEQQRQFNQRGEIITAANNKWRELLAEQGPGLGIGGPPGSALDVGAQIQMGVAGDPKAALEKFVHTREFQMLPLAGIQYADMIKALQQNPVALEQFTLGPGQQRFEAAPGGTGRLVAENTNTAPRPYESSVDKTRTEMLQKMAEGGQAAQTQLQELTQLAEPLLRTGAAFPGGTWRGAAASLGIPVGPRTTDIQVVQSIIDGLTPLQRRGLPGAASDRDMATFRGRLTDLMRTAEGNQEILTFLLAQARAAAQAGQIASEAFTGNADPADVMRRAGAVNFQDVLRQTRRDVEETHAQAIEGALGLNVRGISSMTEAELRSFVVQMRGRFPAGIPAGIQRRIQERAADIARDMQR